MTDIKKKNISTLPDAVPVTEGKKDPVFPSMPELG